MPRLSVLFIRTALLYLLLGFSLGGLLLFNKGVPLHPALWTILPGHIESLLLGWTVQLIMGVAYWILPRYKAEPKRGSEKPVWLAFGLLNLGVWLVSLSPWLGAGPALAGRLAEGGAALAFALHAWPRVKPTGA